MDVGTLNLLVLPIVIKSYLNKLLLCSYYMLFESTLYNLFKTVSTMYLLCKKPQNTIIKTLLQKYKYFYKLM